MRKKIKMILAYLIAIIATTLIIKIAYAADCMGISDRMAGYYSQTYDPGSGTWSGGISSGGGSGGGGGPGGGGVCPSTATELITCIVNRDKTEESIKLQENLYDTKGKFIGSALVLQDTILLNAGRFVGIDAYEEYKKTFEVKVTAICKRGVWVEETYVSGYEACNIKWDDEGNSIVSADVCPVYSTRLVLKCVPCDASPCACQSAADRELTRLANSVDTSPSYDAKRQDVNDITKGVDSSKNPTVTVAYNKEYSTKEISGTTYSNGCATASKTVTMTYTYNLTPAWIDPVTGKVKYEGDCGQPGNCLTEADKKTYIKVPEMTVRRNGKDIRIGWYFVPLNAKSTDLLKYNLYPNMKKTATSEAVCIALIDKYSKKTGTDEFWGNFIAYKSNGVPMYPTIKTAEDAKAQVRRDHGCRTGLYVSFKVQNEFYNEVNGSLNGYAFYYRPIDYTNPFPNGMTKNGYWYGVYNEKSNSTTVKKVDGNIDKNNSQKLNDSFAKITYKTNSDYKERTIREYNHATGKEDIRTYNSWLEMATNGTSNFINKNYGVSRNGCQSFYSLGCGPANSNWTQCKVTEVCS